MAEERRSYLPRISRQAYDFPSDEHEAYRLDRLHDLTKVLFSRNVLAPIEHARPGTKILDFGTGSGTWAIEVVDAYVHAIFVHGIDLAPIQPTYIPLNCSFYFADVMVDTGPEMYSDGSVDLVHMRYHFWT